MDLETLSVSFGADLSGLASGVGGAKALLAGFAVGAIGVGVAAVKMAGDFNAGMLTIKTGAGGVHENIAQLSQAVLGLSTATGTGTKSLTDGLFMIESAGQRGSQALNTLQMAAEGAKVQNADLGVVADATTTVMTDYADKNVTAAQAVNTLIATVSNGKTNLQDLSAAMSSILPTSSAVGVSLTDTSGAMATMTGEGVPAADAATYLRQMLMALESPSKTASTTLKEIGLSASDVSDEMKKSLPDALQMITDALSKKFPVGSAAYIDALKNISGGSKQMQGMLDLTGEHLSVFQGNVTAIADAVKKGGNSIVGWSDVQQDFNFKIQQAQAAFQVLMITLGNKLLPLISPLISDVTNAASAFMGWMNSAHPLTDALSLTGKYSQVVLPILAALGAMVLAIIVPAFWTWATATLAATWPILAIGAAVAGLVAIFVHFYQTNAGFKSVIDGIANGFKQVASFIAANFMPAMQQIGDFLKANVFPILQEIGSFIVSSFQPVWQNLVQLWNGQLLPLFKQLWGALQQLTPVFQLVGAIVGGIIVVAFFNLMGVIHGVIAAVATIASDIGSAIGGIVQVITGIVQVIGGIIQFIKDLFTGNFKALGGDLQGIWQGIVNIFGGVFQTLGSIVHAVFGGIASFIGGFVGGIMNTIGTILGMADKAKIQAEQKQAEMKLNSVNSALQTSQQVLKIEDQKRLAILKELQDTSDPKKKAELEMELNAVTTKEEEALKVVDQEKQKKEGILKHLADLKQQEEEANKNIFQRSADWFGQQKDNAIQLMGNMKDGIVNKFTDLRNTVGGWFSNFGTFWHNTWQGLVNDVSNIWNGIIGAIKGVINSVIDVINGFIGALDRIQVNIPGVGSVGINIPQITHLATGGVVPPGGAALAGETGQPEIVLGGMHGATVLGVSQTAALMGGSGNGNNGDTHVHVYLDGRELTNQVGMNMLSMARAHGALGGSR